MIDWDKHEKAVCVSVTYFDNQGDCIHTSWRDRPATQTKTVADSSQQSCSEEGEKWTHTYNDLKCRALIDEPDREGYIVIVNELNEYYCVEDEELKPIKPKITKAQAWDKVQNMFLLSQRSYDDAHQEIANTYEVIAE